MTWLLIAALALVVLLVLTFVFRTPRKGGRRLPPRWCWGWRAMRFRAIPGRPGAA
jgi:hypothetical protein